MNKNFRVGLIKHYTVGKDGAPDHLFIEVIESCIGFNNEYFSSYNLYLEADDRFTGGLDASCVGKWVMFGFYVQSFYRDNKFNTTLKIRHFDMLPESDDVSVIEIGNSRIKNQEGVRQIRVPMNGLDVMREIREKATFNENKYGKR